MPESDAWQWWPQVINASDNWVKLMAAYLLVLPPVLNGSLKALGHSTKKFKSRAK